MTGQGEPHSPRLFTPVVAVLLGFVLLVGNPWLNRDIQIGLYDYDTAGHLVGVLFSYPAWFVDVDTVGPFFFWFANLRTVLFVVLAFAGLGRVSRWARETAGRFVLTVGVTVLSAVVSGLASAAVAVVLLDARSSLPYIIPDRPEEFFLGQLSGSASFGVLFGVVLGVVTIMSRRAPVRSERPADAPKPLW